MTKSKFQLVGSLLRPADLRKYKDEIEKSFSNTVSGGEKEMTESG